MRISCQFSQYLRQGFNYLGSVMVFPTGRLTAIAALILASGLPAFSAGTQETGLSGSHSIFLRDHAEAPIKWLPWGESAIAQAAKEKKPLFLAIGALDNEFTRAMHQQSFSNPEVAAFFNKHFICVLIDREQRPDIAELYQGWVRANRQLTGWPLNVWLTPDLKPFEAATYLPPSEEWGKEGLITVATRVAALWETNPNGALNKAKEGIARAAAADPTEAPTAVLDSASLQTKLDAAASEWLQTLDTEKGGFGTAPKHPEPELLRFLLGREGAGRDAALSSLKAIVRGALQDHVGGGFFRYTSDAAWRQPNFQKTLLNQARIALALAEALEISNDQEFADALRGTLDMVVADFKAADGGYITELEATTEATSDHFVWTQSELIEALGTDRAAAFATLFQVKPEGNVSAEDDPSSRFKGKNILYRTGDIDAAELKRLQADRIKLRAIRNRHHQPLKDESVQIGPNGLMIAAFARGSVVLKEPRYLDLARKLLNFLKAQGAIKGDLRVQRIIGDKDAVALPSDLLLEAEGILALGKISNDKELTAAGEQFVKQIVASFLDPKTGRYYATAATKVPGVWNRPYCTDRSAGEPASPEAQTLGIFSCLPVDSTGTPPLSLRTALEANFEIAGPLRGDLLLALSSCPKK